VAAGTVRPAAAIAIIMFRMIVLLFLIAVSLELLWTFQPERPCNG
jgi:hypothetical protein